MKESLILFRMCLVIFGRQDKVEKFPPMTIADIVSANAPRAMEMREDIHEQISSLEDATNVCDHDDHDRNVTMIHNLSIKHPRINSGAKVPVRFMLHPVANNSEWVSAKIAGMD